jgi:hypothetical protein
VYEQVQSDILQCVKEALKDEDLSATLEQDPIEDPWLSNS